MMLRDDSIHVQRATRRALFFLPHTEDLPTVDAWADKVLSDWLAANHPDIVAHVKRQEKEDLELIKAKAPLKQ